MTPCNVPRSANEYIVPLCGADLAAVQFCPHGSCFSGEFSASPNPHPSKFFRRLLCEADVFSGNTSPLARPWLWSSHTTPKKRFLGSKTVLLARVNAIVDIVGRESFVTCQHVHWGGWRGLLEMLLFCIRFAQLAILVWTNKFRRAHMLESCSSCCCPCFILPDRQS